MAALRWRFERFVPVEPERAYAWLADHREDDHSRPAYRRGAGATEKEARTSRREIVKREGPIVTLRDTWQGRTMQFVVTLKPHERALTIDGEMNYHARWWIEPNIGGARVNVEGQMAPGGFFGLLMPLFRRRMHLMMARDFAGHVTDMISELNPEGVPVGGGFDSVG